MDKPSQTGRAHERWAHFRFSVIGPLLAAPPARGELQHQLQELAAKKWRHPLSGAWIVLGRSTLERWYYKALRATASPVAVLQRKIRSDHGTHPAWSTRLGELLRQQYQQHPSWSYQLHADNPRGSGPTAARPGSPARVRLGPALHEKPRSVQTSPARSRA